MSASLAPDPSLRWPAEGVSRVPFRVYSDPEIYALEQQRLFRGPIWHFLCLEIEVANPGDFRQATIGETPIVVTRDEDGALHGLVNRCAHKGALVCLKERGHADSLTCVYHSWTYDLAGQVQSVAFRNGLRGKGGMPDDFDPAQHRLEPIRIGGVLRPGVRHVRHRDAGCGDIPRPAGGRGAAAQPRAAREAARPAQPGDP